MRNKKEITLERLKRIFLYDVDDEKTLLKRSWGKCARAFLFRIVDLKALAKAYRINADQSIYR
jgi:hypothetical protein